MALGKDGNAYVANRANLGGVSVPVAQAAVSSGSIRQAAATYRTASGTYVVLNGNGSSLVAFRITPTAPPTIANAWTASENGGGSPFVTSTDGTNNMVVWGLGAEGDQRLHAFNGDTGAVVFNGGGANELMTGTRHFNTAIAARGRIYVANDNQVRVWCAGSTNRSYKHDAAARRLGSICLHEHAGPGFHRVCHDECVPAVRELDAAGRGHGGFSGPVSIPPTRRWEAARSGFTASARPDSRVAPYLAIDAAPSAPKIARP